MNDYQIIEITDSNQKKLDTDYILRLLPNWFGQETSLVEYVDNVVKYPFFAAYQYGKCIGFISGIVHHQRTGDIYVCGVHPDFHRLGLGRILYETIENYFIDQDCEYVIVKTLSDLHPDIHYAKTRKFYAAMGFVELFTDFETWGADNPCLIMLKSIEKTSSKEKKI